MSHTMKQEAAADVAAPVAGKARMFIASDGIVRAKLPNGTVPEPGGGGAAAATCVARAGFNGTTGAIQEQDGAAISAVNRASAGVYELTLSLTVGTSIWQIVPIIGVRMAADARFATYDITDDGGGAYTLTITTWNAAGTAADADFVNVALLLGNEVEEDD